MRFGKFVVKDKQHESHESHESLSTAAFVRFEKFVVKRNNEIRGEEKQ